jgi:predicted RNase H-like HicB family nuclease
MTSKSACEKAMKLRFSEELWKEGNMFVSYAPELDIAACGETVEQAKRNLVDVIRINMEEMRKLGTLDTFLNDAGFQMSEGNGSVMHVDKQLVGFEAREVSL